MRIANPIYDVVFKYLMQNNELATLILSTILEEEILSLNLLPQETTMAVENRTFTVYRLNFSALIKTSGGAGRHVVIEIQKVKFAADIMRFRRYLGEQYKKGFPVAGETAQTATPIISIYFLGYRLDRVTAPVIKVLRSYYDAATGKEIPEREEFIESLTHDSFVIQIPHLWMARAQHPTDLLGTAHYPKMWFGQAPSCVGTSLTSPYPPGFAQSTTSRVLFEKD